MNNTHKKAKRRKTKVIPTAEQLAVSEISPDRLKHNPVQSFVYDIRFVDDGKGNYSQERVKEKVAAKLHTLPKPLLFLSGVEYDAICTYQTQMEASRTSMTGGYTPKVDGGGASQDAYDHAALSAWSRSRQALSRKGRRLIEASFERDIILNIDQKQIIELDAHNLAIELGLKNN